jgi:hypothetical protein
MLNAFGYTPARHAEVSESRRYFYSEQSSMERERNRLQRSWMQASPSEKYRLMGKISDFNEGRPPGERLTVSDLNDYSKRKAGEVVINGIKVNRRNRALIEDLNVYNR